MNFPPISSGNTQSVKSTGNSLPDMGDTLAEYLQDMTFISVGKTVNGAFELAETQTPTNFKGVRQPYKPTDLEVQKVGERSWIWNRIHSTSDLALNTDDIIAIAGQNFRVMGIMPCGEYGFFEYKIVQDYQ